MVYFSSGCPLGPSKVTRVTTSVEYRLLSEVSVHGVAPEGPEPVCGDTILGKAACNTRRGCSDDSAKRVLA